MQLRIVARVQSVEPLDQAAAKMQMGLRVFLRNEAPIAGVARGSNRRATAPPATAWNAPTAKSAWC